MAREKVRLKIGSIAKAVLVTGQAYQDPKDALNEFVSNAADEYAAAGIREGTIRVTLRRRGKYPLLAIEDDGRGMDDEKLRTVARSLFASEKTGDPRLLGEKAIGLLAFQQLGGRCDIVTRTAGPTKTLCLHLTRGRATAELELNERRRVRQVPGTTVYISDLDPDVARVLTQRKVVDYLRRRRGAAISRGDYRIDVVEGRKAELVTPELPDGTLVPISVAQTLWGRIEFRIYVTPRPDKKRRVAVVGPAATTIIEDISEMDEFDDFPWTSDLISGQICFEGLQQTAGRRAILRDRDCFPVFLDAVKRVEPRLAVAVERVAREVDKDVADRVAATVRRIFGKVLKELADLDNPMRTPIGEAGDDGLGIVVGTAGTDVGPGDEAPPAVADQDQEPPVPSLRVDEQEAQPADAPSQGTGEGRVSPGSRAKGLPSLAPDPNPDGVRSRFDETEGVVYYNDRHSDYLMVKDEPVALLDYLSSLVAKEYVVYNNPRAAAADLAEEMVRMLIRIRRHMPKRV